MAVYEYRCPDCGEEFEVWTQFHDESGCPACGSANAVRMMSQTSFKLEGTGWYATDYKGKTPGAPQTKSDAEGPKPADTSSCDAGSKPECATCPAADSTA